jgi:hypothetical protein
MNRREWRRICWWIMKYDLRTEKKYEQFCAKYGGKCRIPHSEELKSLTKRYGAGVDRTLTTVTWKMVWKASIEGQQKLSKSVRQWQETYRSAIEAVCTSKSDQVSSK